MKSELFARRNKTWTSKFNHHTVDTFISCVTKELEESKPNLIPKDNLTRKECWALQELSIRDDIVITKADKGGATVIVDVKDYVQEANRQLQDTQYYRELNYNPTEDHANLICNTLDEFRNNHELHEDIAEGLKPINPRTPRFYLLPKIHKDGNPGRPVISSVNCHTSNISSFVDYHIQDSAKSLKSYVKDTPDFINKISNLGELPEESYLVTMFVKALYMNIQNDEGLQALKEALDQKQNQSVASKVIITPMSLILTLNNFVFSDKNYLQVKGCAMGTISAPPYANIVMGKFEESHIYPYICHLCKLYLRYIDDLFLIWTGTKQQFEDFILNINNQHPSIKFSYQISNTSIDFLDTTVYIKNRKLHTTIFTKPTDKQNYLHYQSEHPLQLKNSIPFGQILRIKRICSGAKEFIRNCHKMLSKFIQRGYPVNITQEAYHKSSLWSRKDLLENKKKKPSSRIPLVVTYNRTLPCLGPIINKHWHILQLDPKMAKKFSERPVLAYRRCKNLRHLIGSNKISNNKVVKPTRNPGECKPCLLRSDCQCCKQINKTNTFSSKITKKTFNIRHNLNYKSSRVIYLIDCQKCGAQYVGKSETPFNIRLNNHRKDVQNLQVTLSVSQHFREANHSFNRDAKFTLIEKIKNNSMSQKDMRRTLEDHEDLWILKLGTLRPNGLNDKLNHPENAVGILYWAHHAPYTFSVLLCYRLYCTSQILFEF